VSPDNDHQTGRQQSAEPRAPRLSAAIGSGYAGYYRVEAIANNLVWQGPTGEGDGSRLDVEIQLDDGDWDRFWGELDRIQAWEWDGHDYVTVGVLDGTHWQIEATDGQRALRAAGNNAYPGTQTPDPSPAFNAFCRAVSQLAAGNTFT
jgi:hypothetical protein